MLEAKGEVARLLPGVADAVGATEGDDCSPFFGADAEGGRGVRCLSIPFVVEEPLDTRGGFPLPFGLSSPGRRALCDPSFGTAVVDSPCPLPPPLLSVIDPDPPFLSLGKRPSFSLSTLLFALLTFTDIFMLPVLAILGAHYTQVSEESERGHPKSSPPALPPAPA